MFVIFGAAGNVGKASAAALRRAGRTVRAVVRNEKQGEFLAGIGCEIAVADLFDTSAVARAIEGAQAVQLLCPVPHAHTDPADAMRHMIDASVAALRAAPPQHVLALSDYGAEHESGTGITTLFHYLETQLQTVDSRLTFLRAAEHMHNWARTLPTALACGVLPSLHHPLSKRFPTVAAQDVGLLAADLLLDDGARQGSPRVVSIEGDERVSALDVARTIGDLAVREIVAREVPRDQWNAMLQGAGLGELYARLITDLYDAHNAGRIDVEAQSSERRFGTTKLADVLAAILPRVAAAARTAEAAR
ncbi:NmrA family transcriptional regulator [Paraburkholderia ginsengiterrae]|uniref:NmrA family transcriptional regulator n=1 Tax=Paraburkholderia ginsengiterrae TaxID=1462993 RepID=A0A1A9N680_9BURK|nr:NAD(P)H-binding protein [Paraburkholderia ginsengiterrae]OAJ52555.1 NmrA family transcriptional regulator [Paraburkholderia ginsengiterrae]OAJ59141.1 NmrA family transcriptional regulator [Paraburkholderia ginsengiterrae]